MLDRIRRDAERSVRVALARGPATAMRLAAVALPCLVAAVAVEAVLIADVSRCGEAA